MEGCDPEKVVNRAPIVVKNVNHRRRLRRHYVQVAESFLRSISLDGLYNNASTMKTLNSTDCSPVGKWSSEADQSKASEAPLSELEKVSNFTNVNHHDLDIVGRDRAFTLQSTCSLGVDSVEFMSGRISSNFSKSSVSSLGKSLLKPTSEAAALDSSTLASSCGMDPPFLDHASVDSENVHLACHDVDVSGPVNNSVLCRRIGIVCHNVTVSVYSVLSYKKNTPQKRYRAFSRNSDGAETTALRPFPEQSQAVSFKELYSSSAGASLSSDQVNPDLEGTNFLCYLELLRSKQLDRVFLDDTPFRSSVFKTTLTFASYLTSIMDIFDPAEAKRESNSMFQQKYPDIKLTYSKYTSLRREMKSVMLAHDGDLVVLAQAYCYFDQIVLKLLVDKTNRKLVAAGCLLLAAKINDYKGNQLKVIIENIEDRFRLSRKDLFKYELPLASALEFELNLPALYVEAHYQKLLWAS
ncbi:CDK5 and ABL1 enzyme substrate 1 [Trichinella pseudospiralis]|uniref:CDK5 and ABL1 enzyme substrate 1 n=2 Tax=Trichinella pseudospiralis TaxID=6337 RepID=A0A0V1IXG9_TRIPS|nr:CDK5 and ABL1 enzyme substrate 1 [Trichinella pseudospiralis]KRY84145.1 CDK5 and ABL1 enzyme substrate 1 [Trichinella pseudospiralis]KRZ27434.1 CDK5 and ABL1 enzyme substrate 1 [Trichinella pseudospiralis]KRZ37332.1 CDK5 and ABL1 enzyme substrate 1 [Trichinella pseudospiralis]